VNERPEEKKLFKFLDAEKNHSPKENKNLKIS
jgi:hypothetical protein